MILTSRCYERSCKFYLGIKQDAGEEDERPYCMAFPDGIPEDIAYGKNLHSAVQSGQEGEFVFEEAAKPYKQEGEEEEGD